MCLIGDENNTEEESDIVRSEEEFSRKMAEEVYDESIDGGSDTDLDLYQIQAEEVEDDELDIEAEMQKLKQEFFLNEAEEEEEKKQAEPTAEERQRMARALELQEQAKQFQISTLTDFKRADNAGYYGGFSCTDSVLMKRLRSAATEIVKMIGKKLFSGKTDLTKISFPIKCMAPISTLELMPTLQSTMVIYLNYAASI